MKILLSTLPKEGSAVQWITPKFFLPDDSKYLPLGLLSLASNLPERHEVKILDPNSRNWSIDRTVDEIEKENPDILGLSAVTLKAYPLVEVLRRTSAPYKVVGGPHTTHNGEIILNQGADAVFVGQLADNEFAQAVDSKPRGVVYCRTNINEIKFPDRKFVDNSFYYATGNLFKSNRRMSMFSGAGCPHRCRFCDVQTKKVQRKNPRSVVDEMFYLISIGAGSIHVYEDNFNTDEAYLQSVCCEMQERSFNLEWSGRGQAKISEESAKMLADTGFKRIHVGFESLSDATLRYFRKPINYKQIENFCSLMNKYSIDMLGYFIIGAPTDTEEDKKTLASKVKTLGIKYPYINILMPLPGTEYYLDLLKGGNYDKDHWAEYIKNPTPDFMLPFPYGKEKWQEDADFVEGFIKEFKSSD